MRKIRELQLFQNESFRKVTIILAIAFLFLSLFLLFFNMFQTALIQSLSQINNEFVEQVDIISGTLLEIINNTAMQMFYSRSLKTLRTSAALTNPERIAGTRDLGNWVTSSTFLSNAKIYNAFTDTIFTSDGEHVENASALYPDPETANLLIKRTKHGSEGPIKLTTAQGDAYSFLFFESNIPNGGSLLLTVQAEWYEKQLLGIASGQNIVILNEQGDVLIAGDDKLTTEFSTTWPSLQEGFAKADNSGLYLQQDGKSGWMYRELSNLGLYYLRAFNTETAFPGITKTRNFVLVLLAIVLLLLSGGILYTLFELYMPIKEVQEVLQKAEKIDGSLVKQVDKLLTTQLEHKRAQEVKKLIHGEEVELISYPAALILTESEESSKIKEVLSILTTSPFVIAKTSLGCAIIYKTNNEEDVLKLCLNLTAVINSRFLYGHPRQSATELAQCHDNLLELWQLRFLHTGQGVLAESLINSYKKSLDFQTKHTEPLFGALRAGQLEEARSSWKDIFNKIRYARFADFRFYVHYILKHLKSSANDLGLETLPLPENLLAELEDIGDLHNLLDNLFQQITFEQNERRRKNLQQLAERVNQRITAGFANDALSAQRIAEELGMNSTYLGRLYRESTGFSISETIKRKRIETAQKLLQETTHTVKDIALEVGFSNTKYFYVVFKELVGMTPREFQEMKNLAK